MNQHGNYHHPVVAVQLPQIITDQRSNYHPTVMAQAHYNVDGVTKGSGARVSYATTLPPSFVSVAALGEWSSGKIFDVYFDGR